MNKPREIDCKKYCKDYETCTRTECPRRKGTRGCSIKTIMLGDEETIKLRRYEKWKLWRQIGDITDNGNNWRKVI